MEYRLEQDPDQVGVVLLEASVFDADAARAWVADARKADLIGPKTNAPKNPKKSNPKPKPKPKKGKPKGTTKTKHKVLGKDQQGERHLITTTKTTKQDKGHLL